MKKTVLCLGVMVAVGFAGFAEAGEAKKVSSQQNRMKMCAVQYHEKKIPKHEYRKFMSQCLRTRPVAAKAIPATHVEPAVSVVPEAQGIMIKSNGK